MTFKKKREQHMPALQATAMYFVDDLTGARHYHLASDSKENVFCVAFPTIPENSDGRAHILEHLALCGSDKFPCKDPFFAMTRRSMATFMNAMTYSEKTVYPFASLEKVDFFNLLDVYLDAAFFPKLDYLDFLQEGWRYEIDGDNIAYQGVVFNEMKGAFTNSNQILMGELRKVLYEGTTYAVVSGGDPLEIPALSYPELRKFHAEHYHPAQAVFMSFGDIAPEDIQGKIEANVLSRLNGSAEKKLPGLAKDFDSPKTVDIRIPAPAGSDSEYGLQLAWRLGEMTDVMEQYRWQILFSAILGDGAAPLISKIENAGFGRPGDVSGLDDSSRQMGFYISMAGLTMDEIPAAERLIFDTLSHIAETGIPEEQLSFVLRDFEFSQLEITGGRQPFGLRNLLNALPLEMNGGDPFLAWDNASILEQLRIEIKDPDFIKRLILKLLASHNLVKANIIPDPEFFSKRQETESLQLAAVKSKLTPDEVEVIKCNNRDLLKRQHSVVSTNILPKVEVRDIRRTSLSSIPHSILAREQKPDIVQFQIPANGIGYATVKFDVSHIEVADWPWLALYAEILPELGMEDMSYEEAEQWRYSRAPSFRSGLEADVPYAQSSSLKLQVVFSAKTMARDCGNLGDVLLQSVAHARFDERERILYLIESALDSTMQSIAEKGNSFAANYLVRSMSTTANFDYVANGIPHLQFMKNLVDACSDEVTFRDVQKSLLRIHALVTQSSAQLVTAATESDLEKVSAEVSKAATRFLGGGTSITAKRENLTIPSESTSTVLFAPSQVNHCFQAWAVPGIDHVAAPALAVACELITNGFLHKSLREIGGAYGGSATYNSISRAVVLSSYRDPRFSETYADFEAALAWVVETAHSEQDVDEAIISVMSKMDRPTSPYSDALIATRRVAMDITDDMRAAYRAGVLDCNVDRIVDTVYQWLYLKPSTRCASLGNASQLDAAKSLGFNIIELDTALAQ